MFYYNDLYDDIRSKFYDVLTKSNDKNILVDKILCCCYENKDDLKDLFKSVCL